MASFDDSILSTDWRRVAKVQLISLGLVLLLPVGAVLFYASAVHNAFFQTCGVLGLVAAAAGFTGAFFGFLFGIPRSAMTPAGDPGAPIPHGKRGAGAIVGNLDPDPTRPNANLEQISDWLTKLLVGATLTQLGRVPAAVGSLSAKIGSAIGGGASATVFAGALLIYAGVAGFVEGWIAARVWLPWFIGVIALHDQQLELRSREARSLDSSTSKGTATPGAAQGGAARADQH